MALWRLLKDAVNPSLDAVAKVNLPFTTPSSGRGPGRESDKAVGTFIGRGGAKRHDR